MIYTVTLNPAVDRELTIDRFVFDAVLRAAESRVDVGGKGFNVSRMVQALGGQSVALGFAGGRSGELLADGLAALGVETDFVLIAGETRTNVSIVATAEGRHIKVNEAGPPVGADSLAALRQRIGERAAAGDFWVLAGSLPPQVPTSIYADLGEMIEAAGGRVVLDTSGEALRLGVGARPFLVKPNQHELAELTGAPVDNVAAVARAARLVQGVGHVVVSLGEAGALLVSVDEAWQVSSPPIVEANPIGAGDALVGGLVWGLNEGLAPPEALRWGVACGAAAAAAAGTAVGTKAEIEALLTQVRVRQLGGDDAI